MAHRVSRKQIRTVILVALCGAPAGAWAAGGPLGIDHRIAYDQHGLWARRDQVALEYGVVALEVAGAVRLGRDDSLGRTLWTSIDSTAITAVASTGLKNVFGRRRPITGAGPNEWFKGASAQSFPSGEVALQAAFVTPIFARYAPDNPWVWGLELLPLYDGVARVKSQAHWQTDVLVGWALGTTVGDWAAGRETPFSVQLLPKGISVGYSRRF